MKKLCLVISGRMYTMSSEDLERRLSNSRLFNASHNQIAEFRMLTGWTSVNTRPLRMGCTSFNTSDAEVLGVRAEIPGVYKESAMLAADRFDILPQPMVRCLVQRWPIFEFLSRSGRIEYWLEKRGEEPVHLVNNSAAVKAVEEMKARIEPYLQAIS